MRSARIGAVHLRWVDAASLAFEPAGAGRKLLRSLVAELTGSVPLLRSSCPHCGGDDHGIVQAGPLPVVLSVSYAGSLVVVVAAITGDGIAGVGVDIEPRHPRLPMRDLTPLFAPSRPPDIAGWTRLEAAVKADGRALRIPPALVRLQRTSPGPLLQGSWSAALPGRSAVIEVADVDAVPGHAVSVAAATAPR